MASVIIAALVRWGLQPLLGDSIPYATFFGAVAFASWIGGARMGIIATLTSLVTAAYFFVPPRFSLGIVGHPHVAGLGMFLIVGLAITSFGHEIGHAQRTADERSERLRTTLASIGDGVIATDVAGNVTSLNAVAESLTGWTQAQAEGQPLHHVLRIVNEETRQTVESPVTRALREGTIVGLANHTILIARDGTERPIDDSAAPIRRPSGEMIGCVLVFRDVSERKRMEQQQAEAEKQVRLTLESITDGFIRLDHNWRIVYVNAEAERIIQMTRAEMVGQSHWDLFPATVGTKLETHYRRAMTERIVVECENHYAPWNRWFAVKVFPSPDGGLAIYFRDVTARKQTEEELRKSEERSRFVRESSGVGFWYCDLPFDVLQWDDHVKRHFHLPPDATVDIETFYARLHPDDREPTRQAIQTSIDHHTSYDIDYRTIDPQSGAQKWIRAIGRTLYADNGTPVSFDGVTIDVTDRKRTEDQIRESEERYRFLDALGSATRILADPADVMAKASRMLGEHLRTTRCAYADVEPDNDAFTIRDDWREPGVATTSGTYSLDLFGPRAAADMRTGRDLVIRNVDEELAPQAGAVMFNAIGIKAIVCCPLVKEGKLRAMMAVHSATPRDWTRREISLVREVAERSWAHIERVRAAAVVLASEERYRTLFESIDEGFCIIEFLDGPHGPLSDYIHVEANPAYERHAGISSVVGQKVREMVPDEAEGWVELYRNVLITGTSIRFERELVATGRHLELSAFRVEPPSRRQVAVLFQDVTARKEAENRLRQSEEELKDAGRRKDEFLAILAHELRNPLAPIRNGLQVLKLTKEDPQTADEVRAMMERQLEQMVRLVDDLMDVSRISRGKIELRRDRLPLSAVISSAVETSRPLIESMQHELAVELPPSPVYVEGDMTRLAQVFSNLLNNAAKYSDPGGRISVTAARQDDQVSVSVRDAGIGIADEQLSGIFEMFSQVDRSLEKSQGGLGIGLTLVRRLVEMHGGTVEARSPGLGAGSEFIVQLPAVIDSVPPRPALEKPRTVPMSLRLLIVDDNRDGANSLAMMLSAEGHVTRMAYDGEEAVAAAVDFRPDAILLDIGLPRLNGYEACRRIRATLAGEAIVIIAQTGWGQDEDRQRSVAAGFDHHLVKPVDPAELIRLLGS